MYTTLFPLCSNALGAMASQLESLLSLSSNRQVPDHHPNYPSTSTRNLHHQAVRSVRFQEQLIRLQVTVSEIQNERGVLSALQRHAAKDR